MLIITVSPGCLACVVCITKSSGPQTDNVTVSDMDEHVPEKTRQRNSWLLVALTLEMMSWSVPVPAYPLLLSLSVFQDSSNICHSYSAGVPEYSILNVAPAPGRIV